MYFSTTWHIPVDFDPTKYKYYAAFSSVDGVHQGYETATALFKSFKTPGQGQGARAPGTAERDSGTHRFQGLKKALKENPASSPSMPRWATGVPSRALNITQTWLAKYPDIDGIWDSGWPSGPVAGAQGQGTERQGQSRRVPKSPRDGSGDEGRRRHSDRGEQWLSPGQLHVGLRLRRIFIGKIDTTKKPKGMRFCSTNALFARRVERRAGGTRIFCRGKPKYNFDDIQVRHPECLLNKLRSSLSEVARGRD